MSISIACACGKKLNVRDEWAGKRGKCPTCGATFQIPAAGTAPVTSKKSPTKKEQTPAFHFSPTAIVFISLAILIPTSIYLVKIGPVKARHDWDRVSEQADYDVRDVMTRSLQAWLSQHTAYNPMDARLAPTAASPTFVVPAWMITMPASAGFVGKTGQGLYRGTYSTHTGEIDATMEVLHQSVHVTGHVHDGNIEAFIDGQPATLINKPMDSND